MATIASVGGGRHLPMVAFTASSALEGVCRSGESSVYAAPKKPVKEKVGMDVVTDEHPGVDGLVEPET